MTRPRPIVANILPEQRPTRVHRNCCRDCPSRPGMMMDPEAADILSRANPDELRESIFPCGWRGQALCKGWHDRVQEVLT